MSTFGDFREYCSTATAMSYLRSKVSYERCPALRHGANLNVPEGIAGIRVYVRDDRIAELVG